MMITCPKCGFSQPQDQYCAKCGVDMQSFKPAPAPLGTRLLSNSKLIATLVIASLLLGFFFLLNQRQSFFSGSSNTGPIVLERRDLMDVRDDSLEVTTDESLLNEADEATTQVSSKLAGEAGDGTVAPEVTQGLASQGSVLKVKMTFLELPADLVSLLSEELASTSQFMRTEDFTVGVAENIATKIAKRRGLQVLEVVEKNLDSEKRSVQWFSGLKSDGSPPIGLSFFFEENTSEPKPDNIVKIDFEILKSFLEAGQNEPTKANLPGSVDLADNQALVIIGGLPRNLTLEEGARIPSYFKIFQSPFYRNRQSEFTIVIEFVRPKP
jgi:hypothetical protein